METKARSLILTHATIPCKVQNWVGFLRFGLLGNEGVSHFSRNKFLGCRGISSNHSLPELVDFKPFGKTKF